MYLVTNVSLSETGCKMYFPDHVDVDILSPHALVHREDIHGPGRIVSRLSRSR